MPETSTSRHPLWIRAAVSEEAFAHEQESLGKLWTFVGLITDIPKVGDWFTTIVGGRSIFIQRFDDDIRAFENRCAHRFYPLRTKPSGNGPVLCGFHHWRYNADGVAVGIPNCPEMFGKIPREMDAKLLRLDLDICGHLIFVRFPSEVGTESLKDYLSEGYEILAATCQPRRKPYYFSQHTKAHWKFSHHISLDDYHVVAVHPTSFGKDGYIKSETVQYRRFGRHSAYINTTDRDAFDTIRAGIIAGTYKPDCYAIYNFFPNFLISQFGVPDVFGTVHRYVALQRYRPVSSSSTEVQSWLFQVPFEVDEKTLSKWNRWSIERITPPIVAYFSKKIMTEDNDICEGQQLAAREVTGEQQLSAQEMRIGWFEEAYRAALGE